MQYAIELPVNKSKCLFIENLMNNPNQEIPSNEVIFDESVEFNNGNLMTIQVHSSLTPETDPCWTQIILFSPQAIELNRITANSFVGIHTILYENDEYSVNITITTS